MTIKSADLLAAQISRRLACIGMFLVGAGVGSGRFCGPLEARQSEAAEVVQIADGVFVHVGHIALQEPGNHGDIANTGFVVGKDAVAVIDTGGSYRAGAALRSAVSAHTQIPIKFVINTHMHPDHVLGNAAFQPDKPKFIAHHKMARALAARSARYLQSAEEALGAQAFEGTKVVLPEAGVEAVDTIDLGGRTLRLSAQPTAHTDNDLIVADDKSGATFVGDLVFSEHIPSIDGSIVGWIDVLETLSRSNEGKIVPGHGPASLSWDAGTAPMLRYLKAVAADVRSIIEKGGSISEAMHSAASAEASMWKLFDEYHKRNVSAAFAELEWE